MDTTAVVFSAPGQIALQALSLIPPAGPYALIDVSYTGISTGTERLLWTGDMPDFPGMGYPLVPGYETVGHVRTAPKGSRVSEGDAVFVPGANCFGPVRGLFGGAASTLAVDPAKLIRVDEKLGEDATLLALAATAHHAVRISRLPDLIVGHGVLGHLIARVTKALGGEPCVWETNAARAGGGSGYAVVDPAVDRRTDYRTILDASGDTQIIDRAMKHLARRGEIILAGFYSEPMHFVFPPAFMREASIRVAAEWQPADMEAVMDLIGTGKLQLGGLITHHSPASAAAGAYATAFENAACLKMVLDWRTLS